MRKNTLKIVLLIVIITIIGNIFLTSVGQNSVYALKNSQGVDSIIRPGYYDPSALEEDSSEFTSRAGVIFSIVQVVGIIVAIITLMIIGIKYMMGSVEEKAEYKKFILPWMVGAVLVVTVTSIPKVINDMLYEKPKTITPIGGYEYSITYHAGDDGKIYNKESHIQYGEKQTLPTAGDCYRIIYKNLEEQSEERQGVKKWRYGSNYYTPGTSIKITDISNSKHIDLYAVYEQVAEPQKITITYNANGGKFKSEYGGKTTYSIEQSFSTANVGLMPAEYTLEKRDGYEVIGWSPTKSENDIVTTVEKSITVYAVWKATK